MAETEETVVGWGTWEELVLGGAVLRHGTRAWDAVASELRARTVDPYRFTPQACEAKYGDLQERYCGCTAWFEELRKRRVAELKKELERSESSIGSLQSKLESLMSERNEKSNLDCDTESTVPTQTGDGMESSSKHSPKEGLSAGSFTERATRDWSQQEIQVPTTKSEQENETKVENLVSEREKTGAGALDVGHRSVRKKRGKRKRRGGEEVKEGSVGESDVLSSAIVVKDTEVVKDTGSLELCDEIIRDSHEEGSGGNVRREKVDLAAILNGFMENKDVLMFQRRLESQKRARYKKTIKRHVDFGTIQSSISGGRISTERELYRDLLLLSNNALIFYPMTSPEYKSALALRRFATQRFHRIPSKDHSRDSAGSGNSLLAAAKPARNPVKRRSVRPCNRRVGGHEKAVGNPPTSNVKGNGGSDLPAESAVKKVAGRQVKREREGVRKPSEVVVRGRKRGKRK